MKDKFSKTELLGATRQVLTEIAAWTDMLYGEGAAERLIELNPGRDPEWDYDDSAAYIERLIAVEPRDWRKSGSAGEIIERSLVLKQMSRVIDYLNTNIWHGDSVNFQNTKIDLTPFHFFLDGAWSGQGMFRKLALSYATDSAVDEQVAMDILDVLNVFFARVHFEIESNRENDSGDLRLVELAAVAGLAEKTVRMAAIGQDKNPELVTFKIGRMTFVKIKEARRWLSSKNIDYRSPEYTEQFLPPGEPENLDELGAYLRTAREKSEVHLDDLKKLTSWNKAVFRAYESLEDGAPDIDLPRFSFNAIMQLAQEICPNESGRLVRIIDRIIHPLLLEAKIEGVLNTDSYK